jgi:hypothetical protein
MKITARLFIFLVAVLFLFGSCGEASIENLNREELFSLGLGKMENQVDLFQVPGVPFKRRNRIYRKGGRIYISNGNSAKIMEFTTYGDLVFLLQNAEQNPRSIILESDVSQENFTNRSAQSFPFQNIGSLVVDSKKRLYVEDEVPPDQREVDDNTGVVYYKRILRFDREGILIDFLGQEGIGGTPFPFIQSLHITASDELVIITRLMSEWKIFWFNSEGFPVYNVHVDSEHLPVMENSIVSLDKVIPDYRRRDLLMMITFYEEKINPATQTRDAISKSLGRIYRFDLVKEVYDSYIDVPQSGTRKESVGGMELEVPAPSYEMLGITLDGNYFFMRPLDFNRYELLALSEKGKVKARRVFTVEDSEIFFKFLDLSEEGILSGLLCFQEEVKIVSWRSDRLVKEEPQ